MIELSHCASFFIKANWRKYLAFISEADFISNVLILVIKIKMTIKKLENKFSGSSRKKSLPEERPFSESPWHMTNFFRKIDKFG